MKRRFKMTVTKIRRRTTPPKTILRASCSVCKHEVEMLTAAESTEILEIDDNALNSLVTAGKVHAALTVSGNLRICKDSLFQ